MSEQERAEETIGDRFKDYERVSRSTLPRRTWTVIRIDGRAFHGWTRGLERPFSEPLAAWMDGTAQVLCDQVAGSVRAYVQSDEISLILTDFSKLGTQPWFGGNVQKIVSISASMATAVFNDLAAQRAPAQFDARVFTVPSAAEAANYLIWRQRDAVRNSIAMAAQSMFSHNRLHGVNTGQMQELMWSEFGVNWNDYPPRFKRGGQVTKHHGMRTVSYVDKRTQQTNTIEAERSWWEVEPAEHYVFDALEAALAAGPVGVGRVEGGQE